ncbi:tagaturonate epimerase family protein [Rhodohalobacter sulfatireducens]|uniref:Tagaturonate/fructuronate epimerase n=1 Tax=Rhodohalobacter sulfatireducens TaxID=2911366 RepID=A0ABS9KHH5_9BACT|nr:tagaturonate epimerase family protein [Rhodohalobacter sulfatireducens]
MSNNKIHKNKINECKDLFDFFKNVHIYDNSLNDTDGFCFFMIKDGLDKFLILMSESANLNDSGFEGEIIEINSQPFLKCELTHKNAEALRSTFDFTNPVLIGKVDSYGLGDRLGNAGPAHLKAIWDSGFKPVLAQQSIRELERTNRSAEEVLDAASWSVFQEGYTNGFGADADHLKTTDDIDRMVKAGYTMFTIDPSEFVVNEAMNMDLDELEVNYNKLPWSDLDAQPEVQRAHYSKTSSPLSNGSILNPSEKEVLTGMVKYGKVINHTKKLVDYLKGEYPDHPAEIELSVDETDQPTTPFEHYLIAAEMQRLRIDLVSLAPRFCGDFEKGIDFKGDLEQFREEYELHLAIAEKFGGYKLSIHSGSDKFSVYEVIGSLDSGAVHVKTAGTSYLEALRTIAEVNPDLFREIMKFSLTRFEEDKKTYHISADVNQIPNPYELEDNQLVELLDDNHARQVLHVAYGSVLAGAASKENKYKERLMKSLAEHEEIYEQNLEKHFIKHLKPFNQ